MKFRPATASLAVALFAAFSGAACKPRSVAEAESQKNVAWLDETGDQDSIAALGRLADKDKGALGALERRAMSDVNVYIAAWQASVRNAPWGDDLLRAALHDPSRASVAAQAFPRKDPHVVHFVRELEDAVISLATAKDGGLVAGVLASAGKGSEEAIDHRLADGKTRGIMCQGISSPTAAAEARSRLLEGPATYRDHPSCTTALLTLAEKDDTILVWLGKKGEPGLLTAVAKGTLPCPRVARLWQEALPAREAAQRSALTVPLAKSIERCASDLDAPLAESLAGDKEGRATILLALDPVSAQRDRLPRTCSQLRTVAKTKAVGERDLIGRADDLAQNACTR